MTWELHRHDARNISTLLAPESVDLIITSPPYFALRSYQDGGEHYDGQLGSEPTPGEFVDALIECTRDWMRVLKPSGSLWVNLGDKYAGSGGHNNSGVSRWSTAPLDGRGNNPKALIGRDAAANRVTAARRNAPDRYNQASDGIRAKSLMGLPWRYALRCIDELGLILRAEIIWSKPNGLPESVTDRVRRSHEQWFHFTREGRYFAAIDEVREEQTGGVITSAGADRHVGGGTVLDSGAFSKDGGFNDYRKANGVAYNPLGKVPGSVWQIPSEPLTVPESLGIDHFAAFPSEWPRRIILGWSPVGYCTVCDEPRRAVVERHPVTARTVPGRADYMEGRSRNDGDYNLSGQEFNRLKALNPDRITGYSCACTPAPCTCWACAGGLGECLSGPALPPTRPAVVLDPFAGTGTVPAVAHLLDRHGIGTDLSADYLKLAEWRCTSDDRLRDKVLDRSGIPNPDPPAIPGQLDLFGEGGAA